MIQKLLNTYFESRRKIDAYFGLEMCWHDLPIDDMTDAEWRIIDNKLVYWLPNNKTGELEEYNAIIMLGINQPIISLKDYTMVAVDTQTDGNKYRAILDTLKVSKRESEFID